MTLDTKVSKKGKDDKKYKNYHHKSLSIKRIRAQQVTLQGRIFYSHHECKRIANFLIDIEIELFRFFKYS